MQQNMLCDRGCLLMSGDGKKQACAEILKATAFAVPGLWLFPPAS
jgi:hypothetical protein